MGIVIRKPPTIGSRTLPPSSRRGASDTVNNRGALTAYTIEKHALWCGACSSRDERCGSPDTRGWRRRLRRPFATCGILRGPLSDNTGRKHYTAWNSDPTRPVQEHREERRGWGSVRSVPRRHVCSAANRPSGSRAAGQAARRSDFLTRHRTSEQRRCDRSRPTAHAETSCAQAPFNPLPHMDVGCFDVAAKPMRIEQ
jgi:hypothetical protein